MPECLHINDYLLILLVLIGRGESIECPPVVAILGYLAEIKMFADVWVS